MSLKLQQHRQQFDSDLTAFASINNVSRENEVACGTAVAAVVAAASGGAINNARDGYNEMPLQLTQLLKTILWMRLSTHQIAIFHAVHMWANDGEVFQPLWSRRIWNVKYHAQVISDCAHLTFKGAWQGAFRQFELEAEMVVPPWQDRERSFFMFV